MLLFSDPKVMPPCDTCDFQQQSSHVTNNSIYKAVLIGKGITDSERGLPRLQLMRGCYRTLLGPFAVLPSIVTKLALSQVCGATFGKLFEAGIFVEDIFYLGDTRSADDLAVFTRMAPERLCLECGLRVEEPFAPLTTGERPKLFAAAYKLLMFVLHDVSAQASSEVTCPSTCPCSSYCQRRL